MRLALAQTNPLVGDLSGNVAQCLRAIDRCRELGPDLIVFPEMAVPGAAPRDILFDSSFVAAVSEATADLARQAIGAPPILVGSLAPGGRPSRHHPGLLNAAFLLNDGTAKGIASKRILASHDVFMESRWFVPGPQTLPVAIKGQRVGVLVGSDSFESPPQDASGDADLWVCLDASPFLPGVHEKRLQRAGRWKRPLVQVNLWGANDELIYDGRSFVLNGRGELIAQAVGFGEDLQVVDIASQGSVQSSVVKREEELFKALVLGVRDFAQKNGLGQAFLGLSGGIDSALVAVIAAEALGSSQVTGLAMPSRHTDPRSTQCAEQLARTLGIEWMNVGIEPLHAVTEEVLGDVAQRGTTSENIQARIRAMILMSFVNSQGGFLLNTSNKTELSLGYGTLYGDLAGALCPIADLTKLDVMAIARWINKSRPVIPEFILTRPPSAELRPDQVDPFDYAVVAPAMEELVQENRSNEILRRSEHKRWQAGVVLKVSEKSFGSGRMIPITRK